MIIKQPYRNALLKVRSYLEPTIWITALILLAATDPAGSLHVSLCPLANLGFDFCPGCGLGHSISYAMKGQVLASFSAHPLGFFAIGILLYRSFIVIRLNFQTQNK